MPKEKIVIGFDPDSKAHGVAVYQNKELIKLKSMTLMEVIDFTKTINRDFFFIEAHIENVCANNAVFNPKTKSEARARGRTLGLCQQSQIELERALSHYGITIVHHKISSRWKSAKSGKLEFEKATGWTRRSNEDTRSAAYFGAIGAL